MNKSIYWWLNESMTEQIDQSMNKSIQGTNESIYERILQSTNKSNIQSINQWTNQTPHDSSLLSYHWSSSTKIDSLIFQATTTSILIIWSKKLLHQCFCFFCQLSRTATSGIRQVMWSACSLLCILGSCIVCLLSVSSASSVGSLCNVCSLWPVGGCVVRWCIVCGCSVYTMYVCVHYALVHRVLCSWCMTTFR